MDKIIPFNKGIRRQPSLGEDGELSELVNLIPKNGELVNVRDEVKVDLKYNGEAYKINGELLCIHRVSDCISYVCKKNNTTLTIYTAKDNEITKSQDVYIQDNINKAESVGNVIVVSCDKNLHYLWWKASEYEYLGTRIPHLEASFYTQYKLKKGEYSYFNLIDNDIEATLKTRGYEQYMSTLNKASKSYFINPFFVKVGLIMYDGSVMNCSPHILMATTTKFPMVAKLNYIAGDYDTQFEYQFYWHRLKVSCSMSEARKENVKKFSDLIRGVGVFIAPLQLGGNEMHLSSSNPIESTIINGNNGSGFKSIKLSIPNEGASVTYVNKNFDDELISCSNFYKMHELPLNEFLNMSAYALNGNDSFTLDDLGDYEDLDLNNIVTKESSVEEASSSSITGSDIFQYNSRLIVGNVKKRFLDGISHYSLLPYYPYTTESFSPKAYILIERNGVEYVVKLTNEGYERLKFDIGSNSGICYFYYPEENAKQLVVQYNGSGNMWYVIDLKKHPLLRGAYAYDSMNELAAVCKGSDVPTKETDDFYSLGNGIYYTNANNPFVISETAFVSVGNGDIIGLSSSAKALSQGQFGQFPMYAFCTDGIWALEVASDGTFSAKQPLSRDVCNNPNSITQIDGAVVFTTDQGLKMVQGSDVVLLSGYMDGHNVKESDYFPSGYFSGKDAEKYGGFDGLVKEESRDFREILRECRIAYDYPNNMLRIYPKENKGKYYVFDLGTREFSSCIGGNVDAVIADYPTSIIQKGQGLFTFKNSIDVGQKKGLLLTRPISLDNPSALKKLQELKLHYSKLNDDTYCKVVMFASFDGKEWREVTSLRGGSYKYFRFGVITHMTNDEALSGMVVRYELNRTNKLR